ncbi:ExbD/TolR family protein [Chromobacterium sphagni]|uniref:Biopolymer transporter ExbD n=1 Tax=Chromobacterium sphagni TaxID=1903179 RepID=A0A1S1X5G8_9NEIS|nr:biopolymer transporter ExbD [Chromobacterium sphagni]OHX14728.1 biopolymer transporter ExbD [Chromobacterium sphagni]OHX19760.1 biopolymer transporter ExbD [Chromobacterium sphagni]
MAMNVGSSGEDDLMMEINTTPLIDVMLVMLIMLIITIPIQTHAVKLDMPVNTPSKPLEKPVVVQIDIAPDNAVMWNGERLAGRDQLEAKLSAAGKAVPQPELHIKPNKDASYAPVAMVLAESQRLGLTKLGIVGSEQFVK